MRKITDMISQKQVIFLHYLVQEAFFRHLTLEKICAGVLRDCYSIVLMFLISGSQPELTVLYMRGKYLVVDEPVNLDEYRKRAGKDMDLYWVILG